MVSLGLAPSSEQVSWHIEQPSLDFAVGSYAVLKFCITLDMQGIMALYHAVEPLLNGVYIFTDDSRISAGRSRAFLA